MSYSATLKDKINLFFSSKQEKIKSIIFILIFMFEKLKRY